VVSSETMSERGAGDVAEVTKSLPGVSIATDGKTVVVRGLGDRYSKTVLNGASVPSLDPEKNAVQLDLFPTNIVDQVEVFKTFSPDLPGDFSGGLINIITKDFPEALKVRFWEQS